MQVKAPVPLVLLTGQVKHVAVPVPALYFPATHNVQAAPLLPVAPALQLQCVARLLPVRICQEFVGHETHGLVPAAVLYLPAEHATHGPLSGPV